MSRALLAALAVCALPSVALAQPTVRVRAEARIELRVDRTPGRVTVGGTLRDDLGQPLPDRSVEVRVLEPAGQSRAHAIARTDANGSLGASFSLDPGAYRVIARWDGDEGHQQVEVAQMLDLSRAHVRLAVAMPDGGHLDLDAPRHTVDVRASSTEGGRDLRVELRDELDHRLAEGVTDAAGHVRFTLDSSALGPPAAGRFVVCTPGDARRAPAQTEVPVVRFRPIELTLTVDPQELDDDRPTTIAGRLYDSAAPLPRRAIGIFRGDAHVTTVLTDDEGRFSRDLRLTSDDGSPIELTARYESDAPWRPSARSARVVIAVREQASTPWPWLLASMIASAIVVFFFSRRPRRVATPAIDAAPAPAPPGVAPARASGIGPAQRDVGGVVLDADEGHPIASARVILSSSEQTIELETDAEGRFAIDRVDGDAWTIVVRAAGYEDGEGAMRLPHRGQWSAMSVRLRSLRQAALIRYRPVAEALAPQRKWWAFWTPRELLDRADVSARAEVEPLTTAVERAAYGEETPTAADVGAIGTHAERATRAIDAR